MIEIVTVVLAFTSGVAFIKKDFGWSLFFLLSGLFHAFNAGAY